MQGDYIDKPQCAGVDSQMEKESELTLIFYMREGRSKAIEVAKAEALSLFTGLEAKALSGGPLSEKGGVFCLTVNAPETAINLIPFERLGYSTAVDLVTPIPECNFREGRPQFIRYKRRPYALERLFSIDEEAVRERDPDQREFLLCDADGRIRRVRGYRGDGSDLGRRALPVCDAQLLVNLVYSGQGKSILDPFAGAGGIVQEAVRVGLDIVSLDIDPKLTPGLKNMGAKHYEGSADKLPFDDETFDAVATEPPYDSNTSELIINALSEMVRVLKAGNRVAVYCAEWQTKVLQGAAAGLPLTMVLESAIDRKGYPCHLLVWEKPEW